MRMYKNDDDKAVSPVIAIILMVAITVVLAGVLYVWVIGFRGEGGDEPKINGQFSNTQKGDNYNFTWKVAASSGQDVKISNLEIQIQDDTGTPVAKANFGDVSDISGSDIYNYYHIDTSDGDKHNISIKDNDNDEKLTTGDLVVIDPVGSDEWVTGYKVVFKYQGTQFYETELP